MLIVYNQNIVTVVLLYCLEVGTAITSLLKLLNCNSPGRGIALLHCTIIIQFYKGHSYIVLNKYNCTIATIGYDSATIVHKLYNFIMGIVTLYLILQLYSWQTS